MLEFLVTNARSGEIICELPGAKASSSITVGVGFSEDFSVDVPLTDRASNNLWSATEPGGSLLVCNDSRTNIPLIAGVLNKRSYSHGGVMKLGAQSLENWMGRVTVPGGEVRKELTDLMEHLGLGLLPQYLHGEVVKESTGIHVTRTYEADKATKRLEALHDLMRTEPVEFAIFYAWDPDARLVPRGYAATRIGRKVPDGQPPAFILGSSVTWEVVQDYSDGKGATVVTASGNRDAATEEDANAQEFISYTTKDEDLISQGWLPTEFSFQPESSSTSMDVLKQAADRRLSEIRSGTTTITVKALLDDLRIGEDVGVGDHFIVDLVNPNAPEISQTYQARMVGFTVENGANELTYISPILQEASPINQ